VDRCLLIRPSVNLPREIHDFLLDRTALEAGSCRIAGDDLGTLIARHRTLEFTAAAALGEQLAQALAIAHDSGLVHGGIEPSNIFLVGGLEARPLDAKLFDFGALRGTALRNLPNGTPEYWSPERALGQPLGAHSDLYALGVVLYECLTGTAPFHSHSYTDLAQQHAHRAPPPLAQPADRPRIPDALKGVVLNCLRKEPAQRLKDARHLAAALRRAVPESAAMWRTICEPAVEVGE
jgi:eukaryotic-like serine/threonine-protein kinase